MGDAGTGLDTPDVETVVAISGDPGLVVGIIRSLGLVVVRSVRAGEPRGSGLRMHGARARGLAAALLMAAESIARSP